MGANSQLILKSGQHSDQDACCVVRVCIRLRGGVWRESAEGGEKEMRIAGLFVVFRKKEEREEERKSERVKETRLVVGEGVSGEEMKL